MHSLGVFSLAPISHLWSGSVPQNRAALLYFQFPSVRDKALKREMEGRGEQREEQNKREEDKEIKPQSFDKKRERLVLSHPSFQDCTETDGGIDGLITRTETIKLKLNRVKQEWRRERGILYSLLSNSAWLQLTVGTIAKSDLLLTYKFKSADPGDSQASVWSKAQLTTQQAMQIMHVNSTCNSTD